MSDPDLNFTVNRLEPATSVYAFSILPAICPLTFDCKPTNDFNAYINTLANTCTIDLPNGEPFMEFASQGEPGADLAGD